MHTAPGISQYQATPLASVTGLTEALKKVEGLDEKYKFLQQHFNMHQKEQNWLTRIKFHCSVIINKLSLDGRELGLWQKYAELHQKIEEAQTAIGHPPDKRLRSMHRSDVSLATPPIEPSPIRASTNSNRTADDSPSASNRLVISITPHRLGMSSSSSSSSTSSSSSDLLIDQLEKEMLHSLCEGARKWDPIAQKGSILRAIQHLIHFLETCGSIKKEIAIQIAHLYSKIGELDKAREYYSRAIESGWGSGYYHLANIAFKEEKYADCVTVLRQKLSIPAEFYNKDRIIEALPEIPMGNSEEKSHLINALKLLANAYERLKEPILSTRIRELVAGLGDERMQKYLKDSLDRECRPTIQRIIGENRAFREEVLRSPAHHRENPARLMTRKLLNDSIAQGYIETSHELLRELVADIVANEAFSRYVCFTNSKCLDHSSCSATTLKLCQETSQLNPKNGLVAWIFASVHRDDTLPNMDEYAEKAINGGFSDPRVPGAGLYPIDESVALSSCLDAEDDFNNYVDDFNPFGSKAATS